ncbi:acetate/propionate family kinase [Methyloceanibacter sp.]|uniref:acetate/propionate family kinase n=1 Tax=Methyloceanibacter sp. TaxID=1965321 RepID=UPI003D6C78B0
MSDTILVVNAGSSSIKFQLFSIGDQLQRRLKGQIEGIGVHPHLVAKGADGASLIDKTWPAGEVGDVPAALGKLVEFLRAEIGTLPIAVGHRVVHGGPDYSAPILLDAAVVERLEAFAPLAPLHQPNNLGPIRTLLQRQPQLRQVACFDTAFHRGHPEVADRYALPDKFYQDGVRRYGFHGLSYEYIASQLPKVAPDIAQGRVVVAHLGSGASMCAIQAGKSVESTMGFTALDGLPMGTRPGQLDAGIVLYLLTERGMSAKEIERLFYYDCGLKGLSGISNDVRDLLTSSDPRAKFALDYFVYRISLFTGMLAAAMCGVDGFVFTAGVGENAPTLREAVAKRLAWLELELDPAANAKGEGRISTPGSRVACYVIPTDEELMIARHTLSVLRVQAAARLKEKLA